MKMRACLSSVVILSGLLAVGAGAADTTMTGVISDTMCAMGHDANIEHAKNTSGRTMTNQECTVGCVMRRGQKYVLVAGGRTYRIQNQDHAGLADFAARGVTVTGTLAGDVITVARISAAGK